MAEQQTKSSWSNKIATILIFGAFGAMAVAATIVDIWGDLHL